MKQLYIKLLLRLGAVCLALVLLCRVNEDDTTVIAGETAAVLVSDTKMSELALYRTQTEEWQSLIPVEDNAAGAAEEFDTAAGDEYADGTGTQTASGDGSDAAGTQVASGAGSGAAGTQVASGDGSNTAGTQVASGDGSDASGTQVASGTENNASGSQTADQQQPEETEDAPDELTEEDLIGLSELEIAELKASRDSSYKNTKEYIAALLITSAQHYNADIVAEALSIPTESNDARYEFITGKGYKAYTTSNMPSGFKSDAQASAQMVTFDVPVWKMNSKGVKYSSVWSITIHKRLEASVRCIFSDIYLLDIKFPFKVLKGYNYRKVGGSGLVNSKLMSTHAFGVAIDINLGDYDNDYYLGRGNDLRDKSNPYCIPDSVIEIFANYGWYWGGNYDICADTMHFQYFGLEFLQYDSDEPFPILSLGRENMKAVYISNLTKRLTRLGYLESESETFTEEVDLAVRAFQSDNGLEPDGIVDYETWEPMINATHDMSYAF